ncbi:MAG: NCS2 family permease [Zymomonas mobilis subsp. pomaceae]|uniref:Xanthine/uracil/vitamin C permease n=1 Tax=Zymomonas mobilis subsp. pomaceae (strain ATCC 29192 / DSM 22645 / JCM 10191 / CCUG 17912 / NBRC 13757 / NCIMB 11200 / NRRL B-4491 / Barker I) TaxID=579138 RepID=F8EUJ4_ZYMMT|nr:NCS2 family permease [Zymomonas mobilis]AEI37210.1 Xanthine/uracil/vitamin C permease [Zymomonas mobilis subsp. pomaceae ATCC 29192]MDX5948580.1 NCS2 family permease [Zymomonas mobilis subsp. pomaceae]GEB88386.1 xanthine/uracil permease [Zymomonas mobilis subsp. pomaceae]
MYAWLDRYFQLTERGTTVRTESLAGLTTFLTMAYIIVVNPTLLAQAGMPYAAVAAATCFAAGFASILMGFYANTPLALAPGLGLNAYFAFTVVGQMGIPWQQALGCVFISGVIFLLLTFAGIRQMIIKAIPRPLFSATAGGIGLFIAFIGLRNAGIIVANPSTMVTLGNLGDKQTLLALLGLLFIALLMAYRVKGAILLGIIAATFIGWSAGLIHFSVNEYTPAMLKKTAFALDIKGALYRGHNFGSAVLEILFVLLFVDLFDNIGTLVAVTKRAGLMNKDGSIPNLNRMLLTDAIATLVGALAGTSTVTSYIESAAGVQSGGRSGLTAVVVGSLFLCMLFIAPYAQVIPVSATSPALILVGALMMAPLTEIDWENIEVSLPAFLTLIIIPLSFSIANGLAFGIIAYAVIQIGRGKMKKENWLLYSLAALFIGRFCYLARG